MRMDRDGRIIEHYFQQGSGVPSLDSEALALIDRAQPFPPPPDDVPGETINIVVPIEFFMN